MNNSTLSWNRNESSYFKLSILPILIFVIFSQTIQAQSVSFNANDLKQKIDMIGGDIERSQNFISNAANAEEVLGWCFEDINFNVCRVSYNKKQVKENQQYFVEGATATGSWSEWELVDIGNGRFHIKNHASNTHLQCNGASIDGGEDGAVQVYAVPSSSTGTWTQWEKADVGGGWFHLKNKAWGKYLQCADFASQTSGNHIRCVNTNKTGTWTRWKEVSAPGNNVILQNNEHGLNLRYTNIMYSTSNLAFYDNAIESMQHIKQVNPDIEFMATMKSDYNGFDEGNHNNLPVHIFDYACVEEDEDGRTCLKEIGDLSFDINAYAMFLADYLQHMHDSNVTIDYLAPSKEWQVLTVQRTHDVLALLKTECANRGVPYPKIIAPQSWSITQGINYVNEVNSKGYQSDYDAYSTHDYHDGSYADFVNAVKSTSSLPVWDDETEIGHGGPTYGAEPDITETIHTYKKKVEHYEQGLEGEIFFEVTSRGVAQETRSVYFTNGTTGYRMRSHYIMKEFTNAVIGKNFVTSSVTSLNGVYSMVFRGDNDMTVVILNENAGQYSSVPFNLAGIKIAGDINHIKWTNADTVGSSSSFAKTNNFSFNCNIDGESINIFTFTVEEETNPVVFLDNAGHGKRLRYTAVSDGTDQWYVEGASTTSTGGWVRWQFVDAGNGWYFVKNTGENKHLQCTDYTIDNGEDGAVQVYAVPITMTGPWAQWKKVDAGNGKFHLLNRGNDKYLQCVNFTSQTSGNHLRGVNTNKTGGWTQWKETPVLSAVENVENQDLSGLISYPSIVSVERTPLFEPVFVSPELSSFSIMVVDLMGRKVFESNSVTDAWDVTSASKGIYVYQVSFTDANENRKVLSGKLLVK
ncbi:MAG: RICIN domain-containing protein [Bacteroidales bacterium]|nr:RICIN domain-containing protein [Bacteroidales bacterium]